MRIFLYIFLVICPVQSFALSCGVYDEYYFAQQENVAVITVVEAKLVGRTDPKVVVTYRTDEVLLGSVPSKGEFSFDPNNDYWPISVDIGHKYIVPFESPQIQWGACSKSSLRFHKCTVYGIKQLVGAKVKKDTECEMLLLRRKAMNLGQPETTEERLQIHGMSEAELQEYVDKLMREKGAN